MKKLFIAIFFASFVLFALFSGAAKLWEFFGGGAGTSQTQNEEEASQRLASSFGTDGDADLLSDGEEFIYGTDSANKDTDGDGFSDGEEIKNGYDPALKGSARVSENLKHKENLTIQFLAWARQQKGIANPALDEALVEEFFAAAGIDKVALAEVSDADISADPANTKEALQRYLSALASLTPPQQTGDFLSLADEVIKTGNTETLTKTLVELEGTVKELKQISAPNDARELHRAYLTMIKTLQGLFADLYTINRDPVKLMRDARWGNDLIRFAADMEKKHAELASRVAPPLSQQPAQ